jgi:stage II sporulation protein D
LRDNLGKYFVGRGVAHSGDFDHIIDINFIPDSESRRVETMEIITSAGVFRETVDRIRWALGRPSTPGSILPSTNFSALKQVENGRLISVKLDGTGNGHGVGMCQCGAIGQARKGRQYDSILKYYYRHVKLARLY